ncbi:hypothetical protein [Streptomyces sp. AK010]|nr:hypothetical protein [Streptomyces sp. AK010]MBB6419962.1 hypothetical protein [Streptomyces sp. AK010]
MAAGGRSSWDPWLVTGALGAAGLLALSAREETGSDHLPVLGRVILR